MPTIPCKDRADCLDASSPIGNFSSEDPDQEVFIGLSEGLPFYDPPLGSPWERDSCLGVCVSTESQIAADLCAVLNELECLSGGGGDGQGGGGGGGGDFTIYYNDAQFASVFCPDGSVFTYVFPAGLIAADSKALANDQARDIAVKSANAERICLGPLDRCCCIDEPYSETIRADRVTRIAWQITSGSLPDGVSLQSTVTDTGTVVVSGTPTVSGTYSFTIKATTITGSYMTKTYSIIVIEVEDDTLPEWTLGVPYSHQLQASGGSGNYVWSIKSGTLPDGLTLSQSGLISGTPV